MDVSILGLSKIASTALSLTLMLTTLNLVLLRCTGATRTALRGDLRVKAYNCKGKRSHWSRMPPLEHFQCEYEEKKFIKQKLDSATLIYQRDKLEIKGYKCRAMIQYKIHECIDINQSRGMALNILEMFILGLGQSTRVISTTSTEFPRQIPMSKEECMNVVKDGLYAVKFDVLGINERRLVGVGPSNHPIFLRVSGYQNIGKCNPKDETIVNGVTRKDIVIEGELTIDYEQITLDAYPNDKFCELHYNGIKHNASEAGYQTGSYTLAYNLSDTNILNTYSQQTYFNVTLIAVGESNHRHLDIGGQNFLELELDKEKYKSTPLAENDTRLMLGTTIRGLYLCENCTRNRQELSKMLPDDETNDLKWELKNGAAGVKIKLTDENFIVIENNICKIQGFLSMMYRAFPMSTSTTPGVTFKEENGITYYKVCEEVEVFVMQDRGACTSNLPVLFKGNTRYLEHKSQILMGKSEERDCSTQKEHRYRVINAGDNKTLDICGGPQYFNCTDQHSRKIKIKKLHKLSTYKVGDLFEEIEHIEKLIKDKASAREMYDHEKNFFEQNDTINVEIEEDNTDSWNEEGQTVWSIWSVFKSFLSFEGVINLVIDKVKSWAYSLPVIGYLIEFVVGFSETEQTRIIVLSLSGVEILYHSIKNMRISILEICLLGIYFLCPLLFLYVKIVRLQ